MAEGLMHVSLHCQEPACAGKATDVDTCAAAVAHACADALLQNLYLLKSPQRLLLQHMRSVQHTFHLSHLQSHGRSVLYTWHLTPC